MSKISIGDTHKHEFLFTQEQVISFAALTGDTNPIHTDAEYAATTPIKVPILHGFLSGSVFSKLLGTQFPGAGSIYLSQTLQFLRPMMAGKTYEAVLTVKEIDAKKHQAELLTEIFDIQTKKKTISGVATVSHTEKI